MHEVQRVDEKRILTPCLSSARKALIGDLKPRHFRGVRLRVMAISWMSASVMASRSVVRGGRWRRGIEVVRLV